MSQNQIEIEDKEEYDFGYFNTFFKKIRLIFLLDDLLLTTLQRSKEESFKSKRIDSFSIKV